MGDEIGKNFGWIGHTNCISKCPNQCEKKGWQYWKGEANEALGFWEYDHSLKVEGM